SKAHEGSQYNDGEASWFQLASCVRCVIVVNGIINHGRTRETCALECTHGLVRDGACCSACTDCMYDSRIIQDGETFVRNGSPCQQCTCKEGNIECQLGGLCPPLPCKKTETPQDQCCPRCAGQVTCDRVPCPQLRCSDPQTVPGACCPVCSRCEYFSKFYEDGQTFVSPRDPCESCLCKDGQVACRSIKSDCPAVQCTHPGSVRNQCCRQCDNCMYLRRMFRNGQKFTPPGGDQCQTCVCRDGSVTCNKLECPELNCLNSYTPTGHCCPICRMSCEYGGREYREGQTFPNPRDECSVCTCRDSRSRKRRQMSIVHVPEPLPLCPRDCCPSCEFCLYDRIFFEATISTSSTPATCVPQELHVPGSILRGWTDVQAVHETSVKSVCVVKVSCPHCFFKNQLWRNGQKFPDPQDECSKCRCQNGEVSCQRQQCPPVSCRNPVIENCCPVCRECEYQGRRIGSGQTFTRVGGSCETCVCVEGNVECQRKMCQEVTCQHPIERDCCKECTDCFYHGRPFNNGQSFPDTQDRLSSVCPRAPCKNPVKTPGHCCPRCSDCEHEGQQVRNGLRVPHISDPCMECECRRGNMECFKRRCPDTVCRNPVTRGCCQECDDCLYNGKEYSNRQTFLDPTDRCKACSCVDGNIICSPKQCPRVTCLNPMQGECCQECSNCLFQGAVYDNGQEFPDSADTCSSCYCKSGNVECTRKPCANIACSHPMRDGCCPCKAIEDADRKFRNGQTFPDVKDPCSECVCRDGTFKCSKKSCPAPKCQNPAQGQCCPECRNCELNGKILAHGQRFPAETDPCSTCVCQLGTISCDRHTCDKVSCEHPVIDSCGCSTCRQCSYRNTTYRHNQEFPNPEDKCSTCQCRGGTVQCFRQECQSKCSHPARDNGCCPECQDCLYEGRIHKEMSSFASDVDPCQQCTCMGGSIICQTITCPPVSCMTPVQLPNECCPTCPVCQFLGQTYPDDSRFQHPEDNCQSCTCKMGRVKCEREQCIVKCTHPRQDLCCPLCTDCFFEDTLYRNGQSFQPDPCRRCSCRDGNVVCEEEKCPALTCLMKETPPGQCCEKCKGCEFRDTQYDTGAMWILPENPCISCTCSGGLVTCMEVDCYVPCDEPVQVPGQCCPVCPTCNFEGRRYKNGEGFTPNGDPCDYCTCEDGHLRCVHEACPSTANCPPEQLVAAAPGECCPSCAGFGTTCTRTEIGRRTHPRPEEPCFYCECKEDFQWECMKEQCKPLSCPPTVQIFTRGQCCPKCPPCYDQTEGKYYKEGDVWSAADNQCVTCRCERSEVRCSLQECPPVQCTAAEQLVPDATGCCEVCQPVEDATCVYYDTVYQPGDEWPLDECTRCKCIAGKVKCAIKKCPVLDCTPDEVPTVTPGNCCPVCLKQPGTCIVFGDPHYRSFDGTTIHFQGMCRYIMAADCENNNFTVEVQHDDRNAPGDVSWAQNFTITMSDIIIEMLQNHVVKVNGRVVELPFLYGSRVHLEMSGSTVLLNTDIGLKFLWNGDSYAELSVTGGYKRKLCGLCGNFNGFPHDDLRTKFGQITNSPAVFGNSWKAKKQLGAECDDAADVDPCTGAGYRTRKIATTKCSIITSKVFSRCHKVVSPEPFFSSCVYDMCACADNPNCLCDILASYAHECAKAKVKVQWRTNNLCAFECPPDTGLMFDDCGPVCPRTCENLDTPLGNLEENCYKPCVASCQCPANKVLHGGRCITHDKCPELEKVTEEELS
ncbi:kielin/chordin-like protein, partial [Haliotis rubra]|uniref:kielin/chordin-like protein n=1 Tax=Haliotis rubra TaxID=36100 RepID=UPI001EE51F8B